MTSSFRCQSNLRFGQVHSVSSKCVKQLAPPSSDDKVLAVQSWDGVPRKNPDEPP